MTAIHAQEMGEGMPRTGWAEITLGLFYILLSSCFFIPIFIEACPKFLFDAIVPFTMLTFLIIHIVIGILRPSPLSKPIFPALRGLLIITSLPLLFYTDTNDNYDAESLCSGLLIIILCVFVVLSFIENLYARRQTSPRRLSTALAIIYGLVIVGTPLALVAISLHHQYSEHPTAYSLIAYTAILVNVVFYLLPLPVGILEICKGCITCRKAVAPQL